MPDLTAADLEAAKRTIEGSFVLGLKIRLLIIVETVKMAKNYEKIK